MGVMDALLADRPEHEAREPAVAARSDDQEIVRRGGLDENFGGRPLDDLAFDLEAFRFVFDLSGPGRVWTQTRNPQELIMWLTSELPFSRE